MISFVIPCYNEAGNVELIYQAIRDEFSPKGLETEIVMVNDGSTDGTYEKLNTLYEKAKDPHLTVVHFSRNFGKEAAILSGLRKTRGDYVCLIDADLQQSPAVAYEMYEKLVSNNRLDCVGAYQKERSESGLLKFFKKAFYKLINRLCKIKFTPAASDFRICTRRMVNAILSMTEYHRFSKGIFSFVGFESEFIPYVAEKRNSGKSSWSFSKLFSYAIEGIVGYTTKPLTWPIAFGGVLSFLNAVLFIVLIVLSAFGKAVPEHAIIISAVAFLIGLLLVSLGILGLYLSKTYEQVKNRPIYIEKEVLTEEKDGK